MKTPDEIKKGLECCLAGPCPGAGCPYYEKEPFLCGYSKSKDALAYIQQLERERDAAVADLKIHASCKTCKKCFNAGLARTLQKLRYCTNELRMARREGGMTCGSDSLPEMRGHDNNQGNHG